MVADSPKSLVSVVIVTWNAKKVALECLESLRAVKQNTPLEIIVVDNASTDGCPEAIAELYPEVRLVRSKTNDGFAKANNVGIGLCNGDFVALINSDVVVPEHCIDKMVEYMRAHPKIGLMGPKMLSPSGGLGESVFRVPTVWNYICAAFGLHRLFPNSKFLGGYSIAGYTYDKTERVEVLTGWFWMVPRKALVQVGGLDERFFMYGEDLDWSYRFAKQGWEVVYFAEAEALHYGAASSNKAPVRFYVEMARANLQFFRKHYGLYGAIGCILATTLHELVRIVAYGIKYFVTACDRQISAVKVRRSLSCLRWLATGTIHG